MRTLQNSNAPRALSLALAFVSATAATSACADAPRPVIAVANSSAYMDAALLAIDDFEAAGMAGGSFVDTVLRPERSSQAMAALRTAEEFVSTPGLVAVVGHSNSAASLAASQIYNEHRVVQLAPTSTAVVYSDAGPYSFRLVPPDDGQGRFLARGLRDSLPAGATVALLYVNDDYGRGLRAAFLEGMSELRGAPRIVLDLPHTDDLATLEVARAHQVEALAGSGAEAVVWLSRATVLHELLPTLRNRVGDLPIFGGDAVAAALTLPGTDDRWAGALYVSLVDLPATSGGRRFIRRYEDRFGVAPGGPHALTYDATGLLLAALADGARSGREVRDYLDSLGRQRPPYDGVTGRIEFDEHGNVDRPYRFARVASRATP